MLQTGAFLQGRKADPKRDAWLRSLVTSGKTLKDIRAVTGLSDTGARRALRRLGLQAAKPHVDRDDRGTQRNPERDAEIARLVATGLTAREIAAIVGLTDWGVRGAATRMKLRFSRSHSAVSAHKKATAIGIARLRSPAVLEALILANDTAEAVCLLEAGRTPEYVAEYLGWTRSAVVSRVRHAMVPSASSP